jgi:hypothetical protein
VRLQQEFGGEITTMALQDYLTNRDLSTAGSKDELFDRSCNYKTKELEVEKLLNKKMADTSVEELKTKLATFGFISTVGGKVCCVVMLHTSPSQFACLSPTSNIDKFPLSMRCFFVCVTTAATCSTVGSSQSRHHNHQEVAERQRVRCRQRKGIAVCAKPQHGRASGHIADETG